MAPPCPVLAGYRLVAPGPCACFPLKFVQESVCCSCVCRDLSPFAFPGLSCGLSFGPSLQSEAGLRMMMGFIFLWPTFVFSLLPAVLACNSCRNDSILLDPLFGPAILFLFSVAYHGHCFVSFYSWAPMSLCFLLLGILGPFANSFGLPRPIC